MSVGPEMTPNDREVGIDDANIRVDVQAALEGGQEIDDGPKLDQARIENASLEASTPPISRQSLLYQALEIPELRAASALLLAEEHGPKCSNEVVKALVESLGISG